MRGIVFLLALAASVHAAPPTVAEAVAWLRAHRGPATPLGALGAPRSPRIFILGAFHGVAENGVLDLQFLRELHRTAGVRTYLAEISHAHALYLNRYLESGDARWVDFVMAGMKGFGDWTREQRQFWLDLGEWNRSLPPAERIRIIGVDFERYSPEISHAWLRDNPAGDAFDRQFVADNLAQREACVSHPATFDRDREALFYANLLREARHTPLGAIFGRLGTAHALQRPYDGVPRFGALLQNPGSPWRGAALTIFPLYDHGHNLAVKAGRYRVIPCQDAAELVRPFVAAALGRQTLFSLAGQGSPFGRNTLAPGEAWIWANDRPQHRLPPPGAASADRLFGGFSGGGTAEYAPFVLLLQRVEAAHPLESSAN